MGKIAVDRLLTLIGICLLLTTSYASVFRTSTIPVTVALSKHHTGSPATRSTGRTKSLFFERVLGLVRNEPFNMDMDKWHALIGCGLFRNLTARTAVGPDGGVTLHVTGQELPSSSFTPEVAVVASLEAPEIVGGVKWTDSNFRGMGERIAFSVTKKEGLEGNSMSLHPDVSFRWSDNRIGSASQVSVSNTQEHNYRSCADLISRHSRLAVENIDRPEWFSRHIPVLTSASSVKFEHLVPPKQLRNSWLGRVVHSLSYSVEPFARTHSFRLSGDEVSSTAVGGTHRIDCSTFGGALLKAWHEAGTHIARGGLSLPAWSSRKLGEPFNQAGISVDFPAVSVPCGTVPSGPRLKLPFPVRPMNATATASSVIEPRDRQIFLSGKLKLQAMRSWGSGCVPMHHETSLASPHVLRGLTPSAQGRSDDAVSSFAAAKLDVYLKGLLPAAASLGVFLDAGVRPVADIRSPSAMDKATERSVEGNALPRYQGIATMGMSFRLLGFRVDYGLPVSLDRPAQVHFSLDRGD